MEPIDVKEIGTYIRQMRDAAGLSRSELADRSDRSAAWISRLESGVYQSPGLQAIQDVALAFGFDCLPAFLERCGGIRDRRAEMEDMIHADDDRAAQSEGRSG